MNPFRYYTKRLMICVCIAGALGTAESASSAPQDPQGPIKVVVWDEQQPAQRQAYANFLGNAISEYLNQQDGIVSRSQKLSDAEQGIPDTTLDNCDVLIWWGHVRQSEITSERGQQIVRRIETGELDLIALHSAHWSTPFVEAMKRKSQLNALQELGNPKDPTITAVDPPRQYYVPKFDDPITPRYLTRKFPDGRINIRLFWPNCCFPSYRPDGKPSHLFTLKPKHPIALGIPGSFQMPSTEMYNEPFHVPAPDEVIFEERWVSGEWFRSGCVWNIGKGHVFYFRPGHETYPVYKNKTALQIMENAVRFFGNKNADQ
ncbi:MAG: ThuA domain-containing protein [Planctomycetota bacterium]|nr:ThuA domain-containing protein [Planctomycetota bacterium]